MIAFVVIIKTLDIIYDNQGVKGTGLEQKPYCLKEKKRPAQTVMSWKDSAQQ